MPLLKSVVNLVDHRTQIAIGLVAKEHSQWIEDITKNPRVGQHQYLVRRLAKAARHQLAFDPPPDVLAVTVIGIMDRKERRSVKSKHT